jgi:thiamine phosphate synthase YjbQ (UPF0047 family)
MKSYRKELWFNVPSRRAFINITPQVQECLRESGIQEGLCLDNALNITPRISIHDAASPEAAGLRTGGTTARARTPVPDVGTGMPMRT